MRNLVNLISVILLLVAACGNTQSDTEIPDAWVPGESFQVNWGPFTVGSGQEDTRCVVKRLGNIDPIKVHEIHNVLGNASHHYIVYRSSDTVEQPDPFPCSPFADTLDPSGGGPLMITQKFDETLTLPGGVGFSFEANQMVRLELHYINTSPNDMVAEPVTTFVTIDDQFFTDEADFLFIGEVLFTLPVGPSQVPPTAPSYLAIPASLEGPKVFAITGHTHQYGTHVFVSQSNNGTADDRVLYDIPSWDWDEPDTVTFDPPLDMTQGGFRFQCSFNNTSGGDVAFGESANQEMCFFWAYYYPSRGAKLCVNYMGISLCCPGNALCSQLPF